MATAAVAVLLAGVLFLAASGRDGLRLDDEGKWLLAAAFGLAAAAALPALASGRPLRPLTLALAGLLPAAAWLSGHPVPALLAATLPTGLAAARDRVRPPHPRPLARTSIALAAAAAACLAASLAAAHHPAPTPPAPRGAPPAHAHAMPLHAAPPAAATPSPAAPPPAPRAARSPADLVTAYYAALDTHRFRAAWAVLAPAVRRGFGGFRHWRAGYATTLSSRPRQVRVTARGRGTWEIHTVLVARDRTACGAPLAQRFAVRWRVARATGGWSATALTATRLTTSAPCS